MAFRTIFWADLFCSRSKHTSVWVNQCICWTVLGNYSSRIEETWGLHWNSNRFWNISSVFQCVWSTWTALELPFLNIWILVFSGTMVLFASFILSLTCTQMQLASVFFVFFVIGLSLVSMCISIMQVRVENKYMAALQLIDKELVESIAISQQSFYQPISSKIAAGEIIYVHSSAPAHHHRLYFSAVFSSYIRLNNWILFCTYICSCFAFIRSKCGFWSPKYMRVFSEILAKFLHKRACVIIRERWILSGQNSFLFVTRSLGEGIC